MPRESYIERKVCDYAKERGWLAIKLNGPGDRGKPDRMFLASGGRVKFIEFKATGRKPTELQRWFLGQLNGMGFECHIIDNVEDGYAKFD